MPPPLRRQAFTYLTCALVIGIVADRFLASPLLSLASITALAVLVLAGLRWLKRKSCLTSVAVLAGFAAAGVLLSFGERTRVAPTRLKRLYEQGAITPSAPITLIGTLSRPPEPAPDATFIDLECESLRAFGHDAPATGRVRLMLRFNDPESGAAYKALALEYGTRIRVLVRLERARLFKNPGSPDFNEFLELNGYDLQGAVKSPLLIENMGRTRFNPVLAALYELRLRGIESLGRSFSPPVAGTLKAMLFGNRYFMDQRTAELLRSGGTFHVLSISGMHIAIIAWALLGRSSVRRRRLGRVVFAAVILWTYAIMVGLAPPVLRATTMITAGLVGSLLFRRVASLNTVCLAALVMLVHTPILVTDPGFQLSFAAVMGIVAIALPVQERLRLIGEWQPSAQTPYPPVCSRLTKTAAEALFWKQQAFEREMRSSVLRYSLDKSGPAKAVSRLRLQTPLRWLLLILLTSLAVQLTTLPFTIYYFNRATPVGVVLNVLAGVATAVLMFTGVGALVVNGTALVTVFAGVATRAHELLAHSVVPFLHLPGMTFRVPHYEESWAPLYLLYFVLLAAVCVLVDRWKPVSQVLHARRDGEYVRQESAGRRGPFIWCLGLAVVLVLILHPLPRPASRRLVIHFLDVGQGDSMLVLFPNGASMLIDGGGESRFERGETEIDVDRPLSVGESERGETESTFVDSRLSVGEAVVSRFLWSCGLTVIDYVLATHADSDHVGGLSDVLENFQVGQLIVGASPTSIADLQPLSLLANHRGARIGEVHAGDRFEVDGVSVEVLWPPEGISHSDNNESVVLRLVHGSVSFLFSGDIEQEAETRLVQSGVDLRADVLKVPHHGSRTSSSEEFVRAVDPTLAVISVGERSRFGHPHPDILSRYRARGTHTLTTGTSGTITVETDGTSLWTRTYVEAPAGTVLTPPQARSIPCWERRRLACRVLICEAGRRDACAPSSNTEIGHDPESPSLTYRTHGSIRLAAPRSGSLLRHLTMGYMMMSFSERAIERRRS